MKFLLFLTLAFLSTSLQALPSSKKDRKVDNTQVNESISFSLLIGAETLFNEIQKLVRQGVNLNDTRDKFGHTALHLAALSNNTKVAKHLKSHVDPNIQNNNGHTALHLAVIGGHTEFVKYTRYSMDVDLDVQDTQGRTALHIATELGRSDIFELLKKANKKKEAGQSSCAKAFNK